MHVGFLHVLAAAVFSVGIQVHGEAVCSTDEANAHENGATDTPEQEDVENVGVEPFELFEDFDIGDLITGTEGWWDLIQYKNMEENVMKYPSLSFYDDKVARKRWWATLGYPQPKGHFLKYRKELTTSQDLKDETETILKKLHSLKNLTDYVAKPNHMSHNDGTWLVSHHATDGTASVSRIAKKLDQVYHDSLQLKDDIAASLAQSLRKTNRPGASAITRKVKPGVVLEERWTHPFNNDLPPMEFNMFAVFGRVWVGVWNEVEDDNLHLHAYVYRNGTTAPRSGRAALPHWINFQHMVEIAERLSAHKDLTRTDIFVGVPAGSVMPTATREERLAAVKYGLNEFELSPKTRFFECGHHDGCENAITMEGARLWIAGYKPGNYKVVPNTEIPKEWLESGGYYNPAQN